MALLRQAQSSRAAMLVREQELLARYPDLKKKDSEFFKATALRYGPLFKAGMPAEEAMEKAAQDAGVYLAFNTQGGGASPLLLGKESTR